MLSQPVIEHLQSGALGYIPDTPKISNPVFGEARKAAKMQVRKAIELKKQSLQPVALIAGGETTVTLSDAKGKGGRNQEIILAAALELDGIESVIAGSCGTDGNDGPTDATGAIADGKTVARAKSLILTAGNT